MPAHRLRTLQAAGTARLAASARHSTEMVHMCLAYSDLNSTVTTASRDLRLEAIVGVYIVSGLVGDY